MAIQKSSASQQGRLLLLLGRFQEEFHQEEFQVLAHFHKEITDLQMPIPVYTCYVIWDLKNQAPPPGLKYTASIPDLIPASAYTPLGMGSSLSQ